MKRKLLSIIRTVMAILFIIIALLFCYNIIKTNIEVKKYPAPGKLVSVDGKKMHVFETGSGDATILLMPGLGTTAPVLDFEPLITELSTDYKVVVVEPFGYGWSDLTDKERTVANIISELRTALNEAGIDGPFILMPHSVSGIYAMYYANQYPDEVTAIIGIDPTLPKALSYYKETIPTLPTFLSLLAPSGFARIAISLSPESFISDNEINVYSDVNLEQQKALSSKVAYNKTVINESKVLEKNIDDTQDFLFPRDLPILIFDSNPDGKTISSKFYIMYLGGLKNQSVIYMEGHHYLHWTKAADIGAYTKDFISTFQQ